MASKVLVKIPVTPFAHVNKSKVNDVGPELVTVGRAVETISTSKCTDPVLRVAQLEQNIRFLQDQHQLMLTGLHQEIDHLRQRNRDLQFQLVFSKGSVASSSSSASSPEDDSKTRVYSPKQLNVTPLQVELLERELGELKLSFQDVTTKNLYLSAIVEEQKKKLENIEHDHDKDKSPADPELLNKLDDVESLVRKLRKENDDLRREISDVRSSGNNSGNQGRGGRHRGNNHYRGHRFPPLHTQSYWQGGRGVDRDGEGPSNGTSLPSLNMNQQSHREHYSGKRTSNNNHHQYHQGGEGRKYRGGQSRGPKT